MDDIALLGALQSDDTLTTARYVADRMLILLEPHKETVDAGVTYMVADQKETYLVQCYGKEGQGAKPKWNIIERPFEAIGHPGTMALITLLHWSESPVKRNRNDFEWLFAQAASLVTCCGQLTTYECLEPSGKIHLDTK